MPVRSDKVRATRDTLTVIACVFLFAGCVGSESQDPSLLSTPGADQGGNSAPTIAGSPSRAVTINNSYSFQPTASDSDGDTLTFTIENKPNWANFDPSTGRMSGSPTLGDVGIHNMIVIAVTDGAATTELRPFAIEVSQSALGAVTLSWDAPTQNSDGSTLTDLAGYTIYYGKESGSYDQQIRIDNPGLTTFVVEQLVPDTYYFAATSFNSANVESAFSGEAVRTIN